MPSLQDRLAALEEELNDVVLRHQRIMMSDVTTRGDDPEVFHEHICRLSEQALDRTCWDSPVEDMTIPQLQGAMTAQAEKVELDPDRWFIMDIPNKPQVGIIDLRTSKATVVSLYAYRAVRQALSDLFS